MSHATIFVNNDGSPVNVKSGVVELKNNDGDVVYRIDFDSNHGSLKVASNKGVVIIEAVGVY